MAARFSCNLGAKGAPFPHFWEEVVGSGHATLALRADWQAQLRRAHEELGFRRVRFHGLLCDDMGTLVEEAGKGIYSFFNIDRIFDFLLSIGMRPFVELSFMPTMLASGSTTGPLHYRPNITPPKDLVQWSELVDRLVRHWVERYGLCEVRTWFFEVWNEPNQDAFWTGSQEDYFKLFAATCRAINRIDGELKVGGPVTSKNAWIPEFLDYCRAHDLHPAFVSTHHYPTDAVGSASDDTQEQLSASKRSTLRDQARAAKTEAASFPLLYTEWNFSSNPRDPMHDEPIAACFLVKTVMEAHGLVDAYSWWTFSDIFEENYFPSTPFHGGFGITNIHGIAKPTFRAFELLHGLGSELLPVNGDHPTVDAWATRDGKGATLLVSNFAMPHIPIATEAVTLELTGLPGIARATIRRIDERHANAKRAWLAMGAPEYLSAEQVAQLDEASRMEREALPVTADGTLVLRIELPAQGLASVRLEFHDGD